MTLIFSTQVAGRLVRHIARKGEICQIKITVVQEQRHEHGIRKWL
jgi:hypothetical protein